MSVFIDPRFEPVFERDPLVLVDAGARGGLKSNWQPAARHLRIVGFEPETAEFQRLAGTADGNGSNVRLFNTALHNRRGPLKLFVTRDRGLTSMFEPNRAFLDAFPDASRFDVVNVVEIEADTLDAVLRAGGIEDADFIKVDTQGSELFVLEGGRGTLASRVLGVEVEVEFAPIYKDQPLFADVDAYLRSLGFALFDLRPCFWKRAAGRAIGGPRGQIIWADALYFRTLPACSELFAALSPDRRTGKLLKGMSAAILYGYYDYALEILYQSRGLLEADDFRIAHDAITTGSRESDPLPKFPGRRQMAGAARRLWNLSRDRNDAWSISDAELGNQR